MLSSKASLLGLELFLEIEKPLQNKILVNNILLLGRKTLNMQ